MPRGLAATTEFLARRDTRPAVKVEALKVVAETADLFTFVLVVVGCVKRLRE